MMTASDLSDQTKNWEGTRRTAVSKLVKWKIDSYNIGHFTLPRFA